MDRGVEACRAAGLVPDRLIGDQDSASLETWQWAEAQGVPVEKYDSDKDLTDFQLSLDLASQAAGGRCLFVTGAFGGRFDHLWSAVVSFLNRCGRCVPLCMADDAEGMFFLKDAETLDLTFAKHPLAFSLVPFSESCRGVSLHGVRWPLEGVTLTYRDPYSVSNRVDAGLRASVSLSEGTLGCYWCW